MVDAQLINGFESHIAAAGMTVNDVEGLREHDKRRAGAAQGCELFRYASGVREHRHDAGDAALGFRFHIQIGLVQPNLRAGAVVVADHESERAVILAHIQIVQAGQPVLLAGRLGGCGDAGGGIGRTGGAGTGDIAGSGRLSAAACASQQNNGAGQSGKQSMDFHKLPPFKCRGEKESILFRFRAVVNFVANGGVNGFSRTAHGIGLFGG